MSWNTKNLGFSSKFTIDCVLTNFKLKWNNFKGNLSVIFREICFYWILYLFWDKKMVSTVPEIWKTVSCLSSFCSFPEWNVTYIYYRNASNCKHIESCRIFVGKMKKST